MINRLIKDHLLKNNFKVSCFGKLILKWFKRLEIRPVIWLDTLKNHTVHCFQPEKIVTSYTPKKIENSFYTLNVQLPAGYLYHFQDIILNTRSSHLLPALEQYIILERVISSVPEYCNYATGFIRYHNESYALIKYKNYKKKKIDNGAVLYLGGNGAYNYYHWLIEIAPKILLLTPELLKTYQITTLILDDSIKDTPSLKAILELFLTVKQLKLNITYENKESVIYIKNLYYINNINNFVFNSVNQLSSPAYSCLCPNLIHNVRNICLAQLVDNHCAINYPDKIFLARKPEAIRAYNQEEILSYFEKQGFTAVYLEDFSFLEQVSLFNQARFIVGPSGAAWTNIIFCQPTTKALSWLPQQISEFSVFSTLAHLVSCDLRFIFTQADHSNQVHSSYHVDLNQLVQLYEAMNV